MSRRRALHGDHSYKVMVKKITQRALSKWFTLYLNYCVRVQGTRAKLVEGIRQETLLYAAPELLFPCTAIVSGR
jgi:hypothetical protein